MSWHYKNLQSDVTLWKVSIHLLFQVFFQSLVYFSFGINIHWKLIKDSNELGFAAATDNGGGGWKWSIKAIRFVTNLWTIIQIGHLSVSVSKLWSLEHHSTQWGPFSFWQVRWDIWSMGINWSTGLGRLPVSFSHDVQIKDLVATPSIHSMNYWWFSISHSC